MGQPGWRGAGAYAARGGEVSRVTAGAVVLRTAVCRIQQFSTRYSSRTRTSNAIEREKNNTEIAPDASSYCCL